MRTTEDRSCDVACRCGATLATLKPGQRIAITGPARTLSVTCAACGAVTKLRIAVDPTQSDAPDA